MRGVCRSAAFALVILLTACGGDGGDLDPEESLRRSCNGQVIPNCRAYEYAIVRSAEVSPQDVEVGDPITRISVSFSFDYCDEMAESHTISLSGIDESGGLDAGTGRVFMLDTFRDNSSRDTDPTPGVFAAVVENFVIDPVPASTDLVLRLEPRVDVCRGGAFELPYRTGPTFSGP